MRKHVFPALELRRETRVRPLGRGVWRKALRYWQCRALATGGALLLRLTGALARRGLLSRSETFRLLHWSGRLMRLASRRLRPPRL